MSYKQIKCLILWVPTVTIALWEYARHSFLLPYISMDLGNFLAVVLVFLVTITIMRRLFGLLEDTQERLQREQREKAALKEREKLAQELHDGISQSLFMLSVKLDQLEASETAEERDLRMDKLRQTVRHVYDDVRQAIGNLRTEPAVSDMPWSQSVMTMLEEYKQDTGFDVIVDWRMSEDKFTSKEKIELFACLREALINVQKHAQATTVRVVGESEGEQFRCLIEDDGIGFAGDPFQAKGRYGLVMMRSRTQLMGWKLDIKRSGDRTIVEICK
ncbi:MULTISPECIES: sensor histidine kinase [unclassified Paenibacillus]|uniref:sensor histidine kinase n=1 Tax=unclassified Paenibacillus TaxID=185978 RepID=UPI001C1179AB|nr:MULTISPECIES: histidine kinase [unclassified Paenibacillus]MBU5442828.1 sensor histidine kinase [Paenibacillus sp. MSJ-34]CAH0117902.1 hypothetical protein PAE9249_00367 [Paenibacillus sp. CECT 9249]